MTLLNSFPAMSDDELSQWLRHRGNHTVTYWDNDVREYVTSTNRSLAFFMDTVGIDDNYNNRANILELMASHDKVTMTDYEGHEITIYYD